MLPNDNVSMSVGHLDHVLIVYCSMEHYVKHSRGFETSYDYRWMQVL